MQTARWVPQGIKEENDRSTVVSYRIGIKNGNGGRRYRLVTGLHMLHHATFSKKLTPIAHLTPATFF
jgi:hypothetical protein